MPAMITTESPYERERREHTERMGHNSRRQRLIRRHRRDVETVLSLDRLANRLEGQVRSHDNDEGFRQRVAFERAAWWLRAIFAASILLYVGGEFFASGDVADWLANQISPLFEIEGGETPVWLRRAAGAGFVGLMLSVTLLLKFITSWFIGKLRQQRATVPAGSHAEFWSLTSGIWFNQFAKAAYLAVVLGLYVWLFGFAQQRAEIMAVIAAEQHQVAQLADVGFEIRDGVIQTSAAAAAAPKEPEFEGGSKLAMATAVIYVCLWVLHVLVLLLPVDGFNQPLEFAHFKRGAVERKADALREDEERICRDILERIHAVDGEERDILIRETQPVAAHVNHAVRHEAMDVPQTRPSPTGGNVAATKPAPSQTTAMNTSDPSDAARVVPEGDWGPNGSGNHDGAPPPDTYELIFGRRPA